MGQRETYAELLGDKEGAKLLALTLEEERQTDQKLSQLACTLIPGSDGEVRGKRGCC
jgi:ferritin-like metal-binding protein YciE